MVGPLPDNTEIIVNRSGTSDSMPRGRLARQLTLLLIAALCPALAFALNETYEGALQPDGRDPPIPIVVELRDTGTFLTGTVKTSSPLKGEGPIDSGGNVNGRCTANVTLSKGFRLRLYGSCEKTGFTGIYTLWDSRGRSVTNGSFRLTRKVAASVKPDSMGTTTSVHSAAACLKANTQCLIACPREDESVESFCSNHCRTKLRICKGQIKKPPLAATE